jgi:YidC/Oxa1 family membrane protein insertase
MALEDLSQRTRFWLTIVLTVGFLVGWGMLSNVFWPKKPPAEQAAQQTATETKPASTKPEAKPAEPAKPVEAAKTGRGESLSTLLAKLPTSEHVLGSAQSKLRVVFSDRGAAIRSITLNDHEGSDRTTGRRLAPGPDGQPPRLVLVTDDEQPSPDAQRTLAKQFEMLSYRLGIIGENDQIPPELAALPWKKEPGANAQEVRYSVEIPSKNLKVTKTFRLAPGTYHIEMEVSFAQLDGNKPAQFAYELSGPQGLPVEGLRWKQQSFRSTVVATQSAENPSTVFRAVDTVDKLPRQEGQPPVVHVMTDPKNKQVMLYAGVMIQFFASLAVVDHPGSEPPPNLIEKIYSEYVESDPDAPPRYAPIQGRVTTRMISNKFTLEKNKVETHRYLLFAGPTKSLLLKYEPGVQENLYKRYGEELHLNQLTDASWASFFRVSGITTLLVGTTNLMHGLLEWLHAVLGNYGLAIIVMTFIVRMCLFPLSRKQAQIQAKTSERMKVLKPEMDKLKKQYGNDRQMMAAAQMELMRKHKINPLGGCSGCLILFLQMPVFLGLYYALQESIHLRLSGFLWIDNLAMPDMLVHWGDNLFTNLPWAFYLGPYLHILPIISVTLMFFYQKMMSPAAMSEEQEQQMKIMNVMTWFFALAFYWIASGLCLYFIISSAWGMIERQFVKKAKAQAILPDTEEEKNGKAAGGFRAKLGDLWKDLQSKADKRM